MAIMQELAEHGIKVCLEGNELKFTPKSKLNPSLIEKIKTHKLEIARELREAHALRQTTPYCSWLKTQVDQCGPVCCEERPKEGIVYACQYFRQYMANIGRY